MDRNDVFTLQYAELQKGEILARTRMNHEGNYLFRLPDYQKIYPKAKREINK